MVTHRNISRNSIYTGQYKYISSAERALKENTSLAINTCSSQILVSNISRQEKEPGLVGAKANSSTGAGNMQDEPEASYRSTQKQQQQ